MMKKLLIFCSFLTASAQLALCQETDPVLKLLEDIVKSGECPLIGPADKNFQYRKGDDPTEMGKQTYEVVTVIYEKKTNNGWQPEEMVWAWVQNGKVVKWSTPDLLKADFDKDDSGYRLRAEKELESASPTYAISPVLLGDLRVKETVTSGEPLIYPDAVKMGSAQSSMNTIMDEKLRLANIYEGEKNGHYAVYALTAENDEILIQSNATKGDKVYVYIKFIWKDKTITEMWCENPIK